MDKLLTVDNIGKVGVIGLLLLILVTGSSGYWVWGTTYSEVKTERDEWKKTALDGLRVAKEVSPVRMPILATPGANGASLVASVTPSDVREQLNLVKNLNSHSDSGAR
jgi:hypothetical protein